MEDKDINIDRRIFSYWNWFIRGSGAKAGYRRIINIWLIFHLVIGYVLSYSVRISLTACSNAVILPLAGIFIGLSFAWVGNANALLQSERMELIAQHHEGGFIEYAFTFQTAVLSILISLVLWGIAGLQVFDKTWPITDKYLYFIIKVIFFASSSLAVRECWGVVIAVQWMLISQNELKKIINKKEQVSP